MFKRVLLVATLLVCSVATPSFATPNVASLAAISAQQRPSVTGRVLDKSGNPIPYANVSVRKASGEVVASVGTISDDKGAFALKTLPSGDYVVVVAFLGYQTVEKPIVSSGKTVALGDIVLQ